MFRRFMSLVVMSLVVMMLVFMASRLVIAAEYPERPITIIIQLPPGGTLDLIARAFAPIAEKYLGKPVVVVNKVGAAGLIGCVALAQANPDGYTIGTGWAAMTTLMIGEKLADRKPSFTMGDYAILGRLYNSPATFLVKYDSPWKTIQQVIADVKAHPNTYAFSSGGIKSASHMPVEVIMDAVGLKLRHVPYQGGGPAQTALIGGHVNFTSQFPGTSLPLMEAKLVRCLAQTSEKRVKNFENIPTFKELGYNALYSSWIGLFAPKGTPEPILAKLRSVVKQVSSDPAFIKIIENSGDQVSYADPETTMTEWQQEYERMYKLLERLEMVKK